MPTPFSHLLVAQRLLSDPAVPAGQRALLNTHRPAYLLGSVVADAHGIAGLKREDTHFYSYEHGMHGQPWRVMLDTYPALQVTRDPAQRAFVAGYVMHLAMDEIWSLDMTDAQFVGGSWANRIQRFLMLHTLLIFMDERDQRLLDPALNAELPHAQPDHWLPFLADDVLIAWGDLIDRQLRTGGVSETLEIFGARVKKTPAELRAILDSPDRMQAELWANVPRDLLAQVEARMDNYARASLITYLQA